MRVCCRVLVATNACGPAHGRVCTRSTPPRTLASRMTGRCTRVSRPAVRAPRAGASDTGQARGGAGGTHHGGDGDIVVARADRRLRHVDHTDPLLAVAPVSGRPAMTVVSAPRASAHLGAHEGDISRARRERRPAGVSVAVLRDRPAELLRTSDRRAGFERRQSLRCAARLLTSSSVHTAELEPVNSAMAATN